MRLLFGLTYYRPHLSGLTVYVQRLAEEMVRRGHQATVLTSRYEPHLPAEERIAGVRVVRVPVAGRVSKGTLMPAYPAFAARLARQHDAVLGNLPNTPVEALALPLAARRAGVPATMTYHCDIRLPDGAFNRLVDQVVFLSNCTAISLSDRVVAYTDDYARHSRVLSRFPRRREVIPPPVVMPQPTPEQVAAFKRQFNLEGQQAIGFVARFATEKGVEYVLEALPRIRRELPNAVVLFAGEYRHVLGEEAYWQRLQPLLQAAGDHWRFTGVLDPADPAQLASFYAASAVTILPSINSTESFGLVQVESMLCGTPVVASDLPGVRQPTIMTGMGRTVTPRDARALADTILDVIQQRPSFVQPRAAVERRFSVERTADGYERLVEDLVRRRAGRLAGADQSSPQGVRHP
jgi:glycosyltransferase involved in cell wall biosynthesis